ncbi:uncharacterized protein LOC130898822 [Diorhabda carinulata]|uniref:uncharacterized protein LOC130898822 n=1 Tax=Diorhabda carinulata TaxID=1163345 RepID=UPI0025A154C7|nr:uncharacterized protein LOC130898822 [Diorhabda carinulata]
MIWIYVIGIFCMVCGGFLNAQQIPKTSFSCDGRPSGYYADVTTGCQVYHMCDGLGRKFSYTCPNATLFQQRMLICDHWYMVNCSRATQDYSANLLIGQRNKPFLDNVGSNTFSRTPRPDLLDAPSNFTELNIVYRTGDKNLSPRDFVGVESEDENFTDEPTYFPPSYWSTEIGRRPSTPEPEANNYQYNRQNVQTQSRISKNRGKAIDFSSPNFNGNNLVKNTKSNFKARPSVYPQLAEASIQPHDNIGSVQSSIVQDLPLDLLPPDVSNQDNIGSTLKPASEDEDNRSKINYRSRFRATTPVYPLTLDSTSQDPYQIGILPPKESGLNFESNFKATTPQYPSSVESTSVPPDEAGLLPPHKDAVSQENNNDKIIVNFDSDFKATTPNYPTFVEQTSVNPIEVGVLPPKENGDIASINFQSNFRATTPQYPPYVDPTSPDPKEAGLLPPNDQNTYVNFESKFKATTPQYPPYVDPTSPDPNDVGLIPPKNLNKVVFKSSFKATTPRYPTSVETTSPNPFDVGLIAPEETIVNFHSDFRATTPNYPTYVEPTSPDPREAGLLAPQPDKLTGFDNKDKKSTDWSVPSKFYQPPILESDYNVGEEELQEIPGIKLLNFMKSFNNEQWQEVRQAFRIPEYDFPLDDATRPSYNSVINSFEPSR